MRQTRSSHVVRAGIVVLLVGAGIGAIVVASLPAACSDIPSKTCRGDQLNVYTKDGEADASVDCTSCLQGHDCCDAVGFCGETPGCADQFKDAQACVIKNGAREESLCKTNLIDPNANTLYSCMHDHCGPVCGIPNCRINASVVLFSTARCDRCTSTACCKEINDCYDKRPCKLTLECIVTRCSANLDQGFRDLLSVDLDQATNSICNDVPSPGGPFLKGGPTDCILSCLNDFAPPDSGTVDDRNARCDAFKVYACGARAGCAEECRVESASADSGSTSQPSDAAGD